MTDVTEFKYSNDKKAYLSAVLNLYGQNIAGFSFGRSNNNELAFATFEQALTLHPNAAPLLHSDRCSVNKKHDVNNMDFYAESAVFFWLKDADGMDGKLAGYYDY